MAKHRIAILSDTHGLLRPEVVDVLKSCEMIFHGGDINSPEIVKQMEDIAPFYNVRGNNDKEWASGIPMTVLSIDDEEHVFSVEKIDMSPREYMQNVLDAPRREHRRNY